MTFHAKWARWMQAVGATILAVIICLAAYVPIQQHILRWRAERLLADIREIQMGKSTWADAQRFMTRWGAWGRFEGICTAQRCDYRVAMQDQFRGMPAYAFDEQGFKNILDKRHCCAWIKPVYHLLGGRFSVVQADIKVRNGTIWTKSFVVEIATASEVYESKNDSAFGSEPLVADSMGITHFQGDFHFDATHPEYSVYADGCSGCVLANAMFTPRVNAKTLDQLLDIKLSCLTRWNECKTEEEIMPEVYRMANAEKNKSHSLGLNFPVCRTPIELAARDTHFAALGEVASVRVVHIPGEKGKVASFRTTLSLKNNAYVGSLPSRYDLALSPETTLPGGFPASKLHASDRIILFFEFRPDEIDALPLMDACSYIPYSPESLAAVQRGIALDAIPERY